MLSNLATYIFGANGTTEETEVSPVQPMEDALHQQPKPVLSDGEEDWVVVEDGPQTQTLGSLNEAVSPLGSTGSTPTESGQSTPNHPPPNNHQVSRTDRRLANPFGSTSSTTLAAVKAVRSAQKSKDKAKSKSLTSKALERRNKAVKSNQSKKQYHASSLNLRPTNGKQLKQC